MKIQAIDDRGVRILACAGELKLGPAEQELESAVDAALGGGARAIVLDLTRLAWLDSAGIGAIVGAARRAAERSAIVKATLPRSGPVRKVFDVAQLGRALETFDDIPSAVESFSRGGRRS